ncbi:MAG: TlyA family RNA methyltransferase [Planctomycetes bacterium]|nr:TlyA family RNA methyltransferase [Planctomycetota bacterium]
MPQRDESPANPFVSRAGQKLQAALTAFNIDPAGLSCADLGCNVGGFTDCLLQNGASTVYAIDTGYGSLAWKLRTDARVVAMERTNALHASLPSAVNLITIDVAWTKQHHILPVAHQMLAGKGCVISLIKPHYEADRALLRQGVLTADDAAEVFASVTDKLANTGYPVRATIPSPILGRKGNAEYLALFRFDS